MSRVLGGVKSYWGGLIQWKTGTACKVNLSGETRYLINRAATMEEPFVVACESYHDGCCCGCLLSSGKEQLPIHQHMLVYAPIVC